MTARLSSDERYRLRFLIGADRNRRNRCRLDKDDDSPDWQRETHNRRLRHVRILRGQKQEAIVQFLAAWFSTSRYSHFEFEGEARVSLRVMLINQGQAWQASDDEAHRLIQAGLDKVGAVRPPREQGQQEWTLEEWCGFCRGPLDDAAIGRRDRFCGPDCAKLALTKRSYGIGGYSRNFIGTVAYRQVRREELPERECMNCRGAFRPNTTTVTDSAQRKYCSMACWGEARRTLPDVQCQNPGCRQVFRPRYSDAQFCSHRCSVEGRAVMLPIRDCAYCRTPFQPKNDQALYCSPKCNQRTKDARQKAKRDATRVPIQCVNCGETFTPKKAGARFCAERCWREAAGRRRTRPPRLESPISRLFDAA